MKDKEYTNLSDLVRLGVAINLLTEIVPVTSDIIDVDDYSKIVDQLSEWRDEIRRNITIEDDKAPPLTFKGSNRKSWDHQHLQEDLSGNYNQNK